MLQNDYDIFQKQSEKIKADRLRQFIVCLISFLLLIHNYSYR